MTDQTVNIGIDVREGLYYVARIHERAGRPEVRALARFGEDHLGGHQLIQDGRLMLAVDDNQAIVKDLKISDTARYDPHDLATFELTHSLIEDPGEFWFRSFTTGIDDHFLGTAIRKEQVSLISRAFLPEEPEGRVDAVPRAIALGRGYLTYCHNTAGDFTCVIDLTERAVSICLVHKRNIVAVAGLVTSSAGEESQSEQVAAEIKTLVNLKLDETLRYGISTPLTGLVVAGSASDRLLEDLEGLFNLEPASPQVSSAFFPNRTDVSSAPLGKYLVALGLTTL